MEEVRSIFAVLSRPDGDVLYDGLITLRKLQAVCYEFEVHTCRERAHATHASITTFQFTQLPGQRQPHSYKYSHRNITRAALRLHASTDRASAIQQLP